MRFAAFMTCILILLSLAVPVYALSTAEWRQDGVIIVRTVNLTPESENALQSLTDGTERSREITKPCGMREEELADKLKHELKQYAGGAALPPGRHKYCSDACAWKYNYGSEPVSTASTELEHRPFS